MHPLTSLFLATDHIADLHRDADRRRLASAAQRPGRSTVKHQPGATRPPRDTHAG
jgi:hypothetical protein